MIPQKTKMKQNVIRSNLFVITGMEPYHTKPYDLHYRIFPLNMTNTVVSNNV